MKRPARRKTAKPRQGARGRKSSRVDPRHGLVALPEAVGKTVEELVVANSADDNGIDIFFEDRTGLSFSFEAPIKMRVGHTDPKRSKWKEFKHWAKPKPV